MFIVRRLLLPTTSCYKAIVGTYCTPAAKPAKNKINLHVSQAIEREYKRGHFYEPVDVETSISYIQSKDVYKDLPVWHLYRRNFKGHYAPIRTRKSCVSQGKLISSNACPICRDDHLVLDYRNIELLRHFVNKVSGEVISTAKTGLCQKQHKKLLLEYEKAVDVGSIQIRLPFVMYDYEEIYSDIVPLKQLELLDDYKLFKKLHESLSNETQIDIKLPPNVLQLMDQNAVIEHVQEFTAESADYIPERPKLPNRYKLEEDYKKLQLRRRRARTSSVNGPLSYIAPQTRLRIVDNSGFSHITHATVKRDPNKEQDVSDLLKEGTKAATRKLALCIRVYNKQNKGKIGDKVIVAVDGLKKRGYIVASKLPSKDGWPSYGSNDIVLVDDEGTPLGTRILIPIPAKLRSLKNPEITKLLSIATKFV